LDAAFAAPALSAGGGVSSVRRGGGGGGGAVAVSAALFWLTSPPKTSFAGGWSDRVDHCGAAWNAAFAAASEVTLNTGQASRDETGPGISKDRAIPICKKIPIYFNALRRRPAGDGDPAAVPFLPGGKICRLRQAKAVSVIASQEYGLY
jgi:hypothetical protein